MEDNRIYYRIIGKELDILKHHITTKNLAWFKSHGVDANLLMRMKYTIEQYNDVFMIMPNVEKVFKAIGIEKEISKDQLYAYPKRDKDVDGWTIDVEKLNKLVHKKSPAVAHKIEQEFYIDEESAKQMSLHCWTVKQCNDYLDKRYAKNNFLTSSLNCVTFSVNLGGNYED